MRETDQHCVYGIHAVREALENGQRRCYKIVLEKDKKPARLSVLLDLARGMHIPVETLPPTAFRKKFGNEAHQGVCGYFAPVVTLNLSELVDRSFAQTAQPVLVLADELQDPQNLGALIRSAYVLGMQGLVLPERRSAPLNETVAKCSSGAMESLPIATVTNLNQAIEQLKASKFWIVGVDMDGEKPCYDFEFNMPTALVIGGEGKGIRPLVKKSCDFTVAIPMDSNLGSLNAATAGSILFYEIQKQRLQATSQNKKG